MNAAAAPPTGPAHLHGCALEALGRGILITGPAASGKSLTALSLVDRGHRLVADDLVLITRQGRRLTLAPAAQGAALLAVRHLGVLNIRRLFGNTAATPAHDLHLVFQLVPNPGDGACWRPPWGSTRLLGLRRPCLALPAPADGRTALVIECAIRERLDRERGLKGETEMAGYRGQPSGGDGACD